MCCYIMYFIVIHVFTSRVLNYICADVYIVCFALFVSCVNMRTTPPMKSAAQSIMNPLPFGLIEHSTMALRHTVKKDPLAGSGMLPCSCTRLKLSPLAGLGVISRSFIHIKQPVTRQGASIHT